MTAPRLRRFRTVLVALLWLVAGCGPGAEVPTRPLVVVSVVPQAWFVERLAGDLVEVVTMVPPGASPAAWEPGVHEMRSLARAALYVKVGHPHFPFEHAFLDALLAERPDLSVVDCALGLEPPGSDPHVWLAPAQARRFTGALADALAELLPEHAASVAARARELTGEIDALDAELRALFGEHRGERFWVQHPAWGHLARAYDLDQHSVERGHQAPDPYSLATEIALARKARVRAVFVQPQFDPRPAEVVAEAVGAELIEADPLAADWDRNLRRVAGRIAEHLVP